MHKKIDKYTLKQSEFYDENPPISPWPGLLLKYQLLKPYRPKEIYWKNILDGLEIKKRDRILDIGCGQGLYLARICIHYGCKGVGIDASSSSIKYAKDNYGSKNLSYFKADAGNLPFKADSFDKIVSFDLLEHVEDKRKVLQEMTSVLRKEGKIVIHAVNKNDIFTLNWVLEKLGYDVYTRAMHQRNLFVESKKLQKDLRELGFRKIKVSHYDAFFTLGVDELFIVLVAVLKKIGYGNNETVGKIFLGITSFISRLIYSILMFLDKPWFTRGRSVGMTVVAVKR